jgi:hypothetical protein
MFLSRKIGAWNRIFVPFFLNWNQGKYYIQFVCIWIYHYANTQKETIIKVEKGEHAHLIY